MSRLNQKDTKLIGTTIAVLSQVETTKIETTNGATNTTTEGMITETIPTTSTDRMRSAMTQSQALISHKTEAVMIKVITEEHGAEVLI